MEVTPKMELVGSTVINLFVEKEMLKYFRPKTSYFYCCLSASVMDWSLRPKFERTLSSNERYSLNFVWWSLVWSEWEG